jgi:hypothetical protein
MSWVITQYEASDEFKNTAASTKDVYRRIFDWLRRNYGSGVLETLREEHVRSIRNKLRDRPSAAEHTVDKIGMLWGFAKEHLEMKLGAAIRFCSAFFRSFPAMANTFSCRSVATATGKPVSRT